MNRPADAPLPRALALRSAIDPFIVIDVLAEANTRAAGGQDMIHMEVGQPGTPDRGRNFVRFSYAGPRAAIHETARRIRTWLKR